MSSNPDNSQRKAKKKKDDKKGENTIVGTPDTSQRSTRRKKNSNKKVVAIPVPSKEQIKKQKGFGFDKLRDRMANMVDKTADMIRGETPKTSEMEKKKSKKQTQAESEKERKTSMINPKKDEDLDRAKLAGRDPEKPTPEQLARMQEFAKVVLAGGVEALIREYEEVKPYKMQLPPTSRVAHEANMDKNRYKDVPCMEETRIVLNDGRGHDYIHANYIRGEPLLNSYICCQGPLDNTVIDFWRMIEQENVGYIFMLCELIEQNKKKCAPYWPEEPRSTAQYGPFRVENKSVDGETDKQFVHTLLILRSDKATRQINHFKWKDWPDRGVPESNVAALRLLRQSRGCKLPTVVHCSAGVGRTGSLVAIEMMIQNILVPGRPVVLKDVVKQLRDQRAQAVQTKEQYIFVAQAVFRMLVAVDPNPETIPRFRKFSEDVKRSMMALKPGAPLPAGTNVTLPPAAPAPGGSSHPSLISEPEVVPQEKPGAGRTRDANTIDNTEGRKRSSKSAEEAGIEGRNPEKPTPEQLARLREFGKALVAAGADNLLREYEEIKPYRMQLAPESRVAHEANMDKNRYKDVPCMEETRIVLNDGRGHDYIHANYVRGDPLLNTFICTQGPLDNTIVDFWRMIEQENVGFIFMLCELIEQNKKKCATYYPEEARSILQFGPFKVENKSVDADSDKQFVHTVLIMKSEKGTRQVEHFKWKDWPDRGVPESHAAALRMLRLSRGSKMTTVVHCSAGVGRTGSLVAIEYMIQHILLGGRPVLKDVVKTLRDQRAQAVQTKEQYMFVALAVFRMLVAVDSSPEPLQLFRKFAEEVKKLSVLPKPAVPAPVPAPAPGPPPPSALLPTPSTAQGACGISNTVLRPPV